MRGLLLAGISALAVATSARADVVTNYTAAGTFANGSTLGGTISFDQTTGTFTNPALTDSNIPYAFNTIASNVTLVPTGASLLTSYQASLDASNDQYVFRLGLYSTDLSNLNIGRSATLEFGDVFAFATSQDIAFNGGTLTPAASVSEPASLALLALPVGAAGLIAVRRRRKAWAGTAGAEEVQLTGGSWDATLAG